MAEATVTTRLKKLINTPESEVKDALAGIQGHYIGYGELVGTVAG